jgi:tRNA pseudouridine55 synthase
MSDRTPVPDGLVIVDKPSGFTSHDVVAKMRGIAKTRRVGHAGTLDPMATGVLVLGVERATKLLGHLALDTKVYLGTIKLGSATTTDDAEGETLSEVDASGVTDEALAAGIAKLTGDIMQVPSSVSAVKIDGKRAYARVREGEQVEIPARPVTINRFDVLSVRRAGTTVELDAMVDCSSGTYVRALARDLGADLGVGGHLAALRRTRVGPFDLRVARTLEQLEQDPGLSLDLDASVATAFARYDVDERQTAALRYGQKIAAAGVAGTYGVFDPEGHVLALATDEGAVARPLVVLSPAG